MRPGLERVCFAWSPRTVPAIKGGPIPPGMIGRVKSRLDALFLNFFPDNPLLMIPFECIEAYDVFFTKERYAQRQLEQVGLGNLYYLPMYCAPAFHHPVELGGDEQRALDGAIALVGSHYPYRERLVRALAGYPVRIWGPGWERAHSPLRRLVAGGAVWGRPPPAVYCGASYPLAYRLECDTCRGLLELTYDLERLGAAGPALLTGTGLWRYAPLLPIADPAHRVTLGEGGTPLLDCPRLAGRLGVRRLLLKYDGANPTGTGKDRSSATAVGAALQFGYRLP